MALTREDYVSAKERAIVRSRKAANDTLRSFWANVAVSYGILIEMNDARDKSAAAKPVDKDSPDSR
jgi:hypothetical protein